MKFGQITECNMRFIFLERLYTKYGGEAGPRPFHKKSNLSIFLDQHCEMLYSQSILTLFPPRNRVNIKKQFELLA